MWGRWFKKFENFWLNDYLRRCQNEFKCTIDFQGHNVIVGLYPFEDTETKGMGRILQSKISLQFIDGIKSHLSTFHLGTSENTRKRHERKKSGGE